MVPLQVHARSQISERRARPAQRYSALELVLTLGIARRKARRRFSRQLLGLMGAMLRDFQASLSPFSDRQLKSRCAKLALSLGRRCVMASPDALDLYNEYLSIVEETTDDRTAERVLLIAFRLLQIAEDDFARHAELHEAAKNFDWPAREDPAAIAWPPGA
jgi:hypothetical protein